MSIDVALQGVDDLQLGHLRHFDNLSRQMPNEWNLMKGKGYGQEDFGGYRFQLAYMAYALALTHRHRLPAAPGVFKPIFERLIEKILLPEVWMYWRDVSRGGSIFNAHLAERYQETWNPVARDNIMYSAYVQSMALIYDYLFDDRRYAEPGALTFRYWSYFWGGPERRFAYDQNSLNEHVYWQMVESGFLGVACEPNCVFQICNQPAILGFRMHDLLNGSDRATEVTRSYEQAWADFGRIGDNGHYNIMLSQDTKTIRQNAGKVPWVDAWNGTLLNMWNRDFVREHYPHQIGELLKQGFSGAMSVNVPARPEVMGQRLVLDSCDFGWVTAWTSEMGDAQTLCGLLTHADRYMAPTWRDGGLYYPRNDSETDADDNWTMMEPMTGNVLLGYARLNVPDGLWRFYNDPWDRSHHSEPGLVRVARNIDVSQAVFDGATSELHFTLKARDDVSGDRSVLIGNLGARGAWSLVSDGRVVARGHAGDIESADTDVASEQHGVALRCPVGGKQAFTMTFAPAGPAS